MRISRHTNDPLGSTQTQARAPQTLSKTPTTRPLTGRNTKFCSVLACSLHSCSVVYGFSGYKIQIQIHSASTNFPYRTMHARTELVDRVVNTADPPMGLLEPVLLFALLIFRAIVECDGTLPGRVRILSVFRSLAGA